MFPEDLKYNKEHLWVRAEGETARVGLTHFAQEQLGDIVFVQLPEVGSHIRAAEAFGTIESVKSVSDLFSPVSGEVAEVHEALENEPEIINHDPYGKGWILLIRMENPAELDTLMDADEYRAHAEEETP